MSFLTQVCKIFVTFMFQEEKSKVHEISFRKIALVLLQNHCHLTRFYQNHLNIPHCDSTQFLSRKVKINPHIYKKSKTLTSFQRYNHLSRTFLHEKLKIFWLEGWKWHTRELQLY